MSLVFLENCSYEKSVRIAIFVNWHYSVLLNQLKLERANGSQCNSLSSQQSNSKQSDDFN